MAVSWIFNTESEVRREHILVIMNRALDVENPKVIIIPAGENPSTTEPVYHQPWSEFPEAIYLDHPGRYLLALVNAGENLEHHTYVRVPPWMSLADAVQPAGSNITLPVGPFSNVEYRFDEPSLIGQVFSDWAEVIGQWRSANRWMLEEFVQTEVNHAIGAGAAVGVLGYVLGKLLQQNEIKTPDGDPLTTAERAVLIRFGLEATVCIWPIELLDEAQRHCKALAGQKIELPIQPFDLMLWVPQKPTSVMIAEEKHGYLGQFIFRMDHGGLLCADVMMGPDDGDINEVLVQGIQIENGHVLSNSSISASALIVAKCALFACDDMLDDAPLVARAKAYKTRTTKPSWHRRQASAYLVGGRLLQPQGVSKTGHAKSRLSFRFSVRRHMRMQPCGPGRKNRRPIMVKPHIKGPKGAAFRSGVRKVEK